MLLKKMYKKKEKNQPNTWQSAPQAGDAVSVNWQVEQEKEA